MNISKWHCSRLRTSGDSPGIDIGASDGTNIATVHYDMASQTPEDVRSIADTIVRLHEAAIAETMTTPLTPREP